jgi:hypothetical protein
VCIANFVSFLSRFFRAGSLNLTCAPVYENRAFVVGALLFSSLSVSLLRMPHNETFVFIIPVFLLQTFDYSSRVNVVEISEFGAIHLDTCGIRSHTSEGDDFLVVKNDFRGCLGFDGLTLAELRSRSRVNCQRNSLDGNIQLFHAAFSPCVSPRRIREFQTRFNGCKSDSFSVFTPPPPLFSFDSSA